MLPFEFGDPIKSVHVKPSVQITIAPAESNSLIPETLAGPSVFNQPDSTLHKVKSYSGQSN